MSHTDGAAVTAAHEARCDVVVVGSGAGGAVTAAALAEAGLRVILVEEGAWIRGDRMNGRPLAMFDLLYRDRGLTGTVGLPPIPVPLGKAVGGTTVINSATCFRTPPAVLARWRRDFGVEGIDALDPFYDEVERDLDIKPVPDHIYGPQARRFEAAATALGYRGQRIPRNERDCDGFGVCAFGCPKDAKQAMSVSYVPRALAAGASLWSRARVEGIVIERGIAKGIRGRFCGPAGRAGAVPFTIHAERVIIAAGALFTPPLLLKSGVRHPLLGRNLHMHPATRVLARYPEAVSGWAEVPQSYNIDEFIDDGIFIQGQFTPPGVQAPNVPGFGAAHRARMEGFDRLGSFGALISDQSAGRVFRSGLAWYRLNAADTEKLRRAIALTTEIFLQAGAEEVYSGVAVQPIVRGQADLDALRTRRVRAADIEMMAFHPMGTCAAGGDPSLGVCDPRGAVHGLRGLHVADTSLFPTSNRINPQLTLMAWALANARAMAA
jgi:choline dehydrogenase-like flavoprotein